MNKTDLIEQLGRRAGLSGDGARSAIEALFGSSSEAGLIGAALRAGERVQLAGFGTFEARARKERLGRNPHTRERIVIPAGKAAAFRPGSVLKSQLR
jgi:DNA-binding protein HU-beta